MGEEVLAGKAGRPKFGSSLSAKSWCASVTPAPGLGQRQEEHKDSLANRWGGSGLHLQGETAKT